MENQESNANRAIDKIVCWVAIGFRGYLLCVFWTGCHSFIVSENSFHLQICDANYGGYIPKEGLDMFCIWFDDTYIQSFHSCLIARCVKQNKNIFQVYSTHKMQGDNTENVRENNDKSARESVDNLHSIVKIRKLMHVYSHTHRSIL